MAHEKNTSPVNSHSNGQMNLWNKYDDASVWEDGCQCFPFVENSLGMLTSNRHNGNGCTALHGALLERDLALVESALSAGASPHMWLEGQPPLHVAAAMGAFPGAELFAAQSTEALLQAGALLNQRDTAGNTPLHTASNLGLLEMVNVLLNSKGCLVHAQDNNGRSPMHLAALGGHKEVVKALLEAGCSPNAGDLWDQTPLHLAILGGRHREISELLLDSGADPTKVDKLGNAAESVTNPDDTLDRGKDKGMAIVFNPDCESHPGTGRRLKCLYHPKYGILHTKEFQQVEWVQPHQKASISDILRIHEYEYVKKVEDLCANLETPHPSLCPHSYRACFAAVGAVLEGVDRVVAGQNTPAFCAIGHSGHLIGDSGAVDEKACGLFNVVSIGASYACNVHRSSIKRVAIIDFDAQPATGTEDILWNLIPSYQQVPVDTPEYKGLMTLCKYKPWVDFDDADNVLLVSSQVEGMEDGSNVDILPDLSVCSQPTYSTAAAGSLKGAEMIMNVDLNHLEGSPKDFHRLQFRQAYRQGVFPRLVEFDPDLILVSAGFSGHEGDAGLYGCQLVEEDFEWLTSQIMKVANKCCEGRVVTVLDGGRQAEGWAASVLARSVAAHCRALVQTKASDRWDPEKAKLEGIVEEKVFTDRWNDAAARRVQTLVRGWIDRRRYPRIKSSIIAFQTCFRRWRCQKRFQNLFDNLTKFKAVFRGRQCRKLFAAEKAEKLRAIIRIQAWVRGWLERSNYAWRKRASTIELDIDVRCKQLFVANRAELYNIFQSYMDKPQKAILRKEAVLFAVNFKLVPTFCSHKQFEAIINDVVDILNSNPFQKVEMIDSNSAPLDYVSFLKLLLLTARLSKTTIKRNISVAERLSEMMSYMDNSGGKQKMGGTLHRNTFSMGNMVYLDSQKLPAPEIALAFDLNDWVRETHIQKKRSFRRESSDRPKSPNPRRPSASPRSSTSPKGSPLAHSASPRKKLASSNGNQLKYSQSCREMVSDGRKSLNKDRNGELRQSNGSPPALPTPKLRSVKSGELSQSSGSPPALPTPKLRSVKSEPAGLVQKEVTKIEETIATSKSERSTLIPRTPIRSKQSKAQSERSPRSSTASPSALQMKSQSARSPRSSTESPAASPSKIPRHKKSLGGV